MNQVMNFLIPSFIMFVTSFINAVVIGTILFITYPSIHSVFPNLIGIIAPAIRWWDAVYISWIITIITSLIFSSQIKPIIITK